MAALMMLAMFHRLQEPLPEASTSRCSTRIVRCGICVQDNSNFAAVDIMVEINDSETAVIAKQGDSAIELDSKQLAAVTYIDRVIEEGGTPLESASAWPTHRSAPSVSMMAGREIAASSLLTMI